MLTIGENHAYLAEFWLIWVLIFLLFVGLYWKVELRKQSSCSMQLSNKTDQYIAFKVTNLKIYSLNLINQSYVRCVKCWVVLILCVGQVKTTNPKKYCVRPNAGVVLPGSSCNVTGNISFYLFVSCACWITPSVPIYLTHFFFFWHPNIEVKWISLTQYIVQCNYIEFEGDSIRYELQNVVELIL